MCYLQRGIYSLLLFYSLAMGNCLKGTASDDVSLLRGGEGTRESSSSEQIHGSENYPQVSIIPS
jgi:hypothetical protein